MPYQRVTRGAAVRQIMPPCQIDSEIGRKQQTTSPLEVKFKQMRRCWRIPNTASACEEAPSAHLRKTPAFFNARLVRRKMFSVR
jgi:hypothetical protein